MSRFRYVLDLQMFSQEKTEKATPKKRQDSRKKGQVAKSMELPGAFILLFTFLSFIIFGGYLRDRVTGLFSAVFYDYIGMQVTESNVYQLGVSLVLELLLMLFPILLIAMVMAFLGNYMQIGFLLTGDPLKMKLNKLNPLEGAKRIFSMRSVVDFLKSLFKVSIVGYVVYSTLWGEREYMFILAQLPLEETLRFVSSLTVQLGVKIGAILLVLAVLDYMYQRYDHEKRICMSKQDIKDEYKKAEGDPLIKAKIKERQRKMAMQRMMEEVPKADVIITNPTHYAIALKYDAEEMEAPTLLAKGTDHVALKIRELAKEHDIMMMENKPLARALYDQVEIGQEVPADLFQAVAEVLAYVYKLKGRVN